MPAPGAERQGCRPTVTRKRAKQAGERTLRVLL